MYIQGLWESQTKKEKLVRMDVKDPNAYVLHFIKISLAKIKERITMTVLHFGILRGSESPLSRVGSYLLASNYANFFMAVAISIPT